MDFQELKALDDQYVMHTYGRFPVAIDHGKGATLYDPEGKAYIDFASGIGVTSLGYGDEDWTAPLPVRDWAAFEKEWSTANAAANPGEESIAGILPAGSSIDAAVAAAKEKGNNRRLQQYFGPGRAPDGQAGLRERQLLSY